MSNIIINSISVTQLREKKSKRLVVNMYTYPELYVDKYIKLLLDSDGDIITILTVDTGIWIFRYPMINKDAIIFEEIGTDLWKKLTNQPFHDGGI